MPLKFVTVNDNVFQLLGDPLPGLRPWTPLGDFHPQTPSLVQFKNFLKKSPGPIY